MTGLRFGGTLPSLGHNGSRKGDVNTEGGEETMWYLVKGEYVDPGALLPPAQTADLIERSVNPSLDALAKMAKKKQIFGGLPVGERAVVFVLDAASHEDVDAMLSGLPFWGLLKWQVTPLDSFSHRLGQHPALVARLKAAAGG
jgi:muconolactone delta-isomerase